MAFEVVYQKRNPEAYDHGGVPEWLKLRDSLELKDGEQVVTFGNISVSVYVEEESILIHAGGVTEEARKFVLLPQLTGFVGEDVPLSNLGTLEDVSFSLLEGGDVLIYIMNQL